MLQTFLIVRSKIGIYILKTIWFVVSDRQRQRNIYSKTISNLFQIYLETEDHVQDKDH